LALYTFFIFLFVLYVIFRTVVQQLTRFQLT